jgi:hypothetical protein
MPKDENVPALGRVAEIHWSTSSATGATGSERRSSSDEVIGHD